MKPLSAAAEKAMDASEKPRQWYWCRRPNGFSARAKWGVIAAKLEMPRYQVVAFVNRLDELANEADPRGYVGHFDPEEFGVDLGMPAGDAARIFAALEDGANPWIISDHVATFYSRNPDREDPTATLRDRRRRVRAAIIKKLADLFRTGRVDLDRRVAIEGRLKSMPDDELFELPLTLAREELSPVSEPTRGTRRETVSLTPEQSRPNFPESVDNSGDKASGAPAGSGETRAETPAIEPQQQAELWLATDGTRIVTEQLLENPQLAATKIARWRNQELGGDAATLAEIIRGAEKSGLFGATFLNLIVVGVRDAKRRATAQGELRLPHVLASERKMA